MFVHADDHLGTGTSDGRKEGGRLECPAKTACDQCLEFKVTKKFRCRCRLFSADFRNAGVTDPEFVRLRIVG